MTTTMMMNAVAKIKTTVSNEYNDCARAMEMALHTTVYSNDSTTRFVVKPARGGQQCIFDYFD